MKQTFKTNGRRALGGLIVCVAGGNRHLATCVGVTHFSKGLPQYARQSHSIHDRRGLPATKRRILDAAETLFMEHGFEATSLRAITTAAEVNLAAANYHFGSKEELFQAVLTRRLDPMNEARLELLTRFEHASAPRAVPCEKILAALFIPALELARDRDRGGENFLRLLGPRLRRPRAFHSQVPVATNTR